MLIELCLAAATVAGLHALAPDHWAPLTVIARHARWRPARLGILASLAAVLHVSVSVLLGLLAIYLGAGVLQLQWFEGLRADLFWWAMTVFGGVYALWGVMRRASAQPSHVGIVTLLLVLGPCEPLIPLMIAAFTEGRFALVAISVIYAMTTVAVMMGMTLLGYFGFRLNLSTSAPRIAHALPGLAIAGIAVAVKLLGW